MLLKVVVNIMGGKLTNQESWGGLVIVNHVCGMQWRNDFGDALTVSEGCM